MDHILILLMLLAGNRINTEWKSTLTSHEAKQGVTENADFIILRS